jgi:hypothetical protein
MWRFGFTDALLFDTDSGGAPGGSGDAGGGGSPPATTQSPQAGDSTPNQFDQLVQLINEPAPAPTQAAGQTGQQSAAEQVLRSGSAPQGGQQDPNQQLGARPLARVQPGQQPAPPTAGQQPTPPDPRDEALRALQTELAQLRGQMQGLAQPRQQEPVQQPQQPQRRYNFSAPPQVMEALRSEDPGVATQTFFTLLSDMAENVHRTVMQEVQQGLAPHLLRAAVTQADTTVQTQRVEHDFYGAHKDLDQEHLRPLVRTVAANYLTELGPRFKSYTPDFRDEVARRTRELIYRTAGVAQNFRPSPDQVAGRNGPAQLSPQGTRPNSGIQPNGAVQDHNSPAAIAAALFG